MYRRVPFRSGIVARTDFCSSAIPAVLTTRGGVGNFFFLKKGKCCHAQSARQPIISHKRLPCLLSAAANHFFFRWIPLQCTSQTFQTDGPSSQMDRDRKISSISLFNHLDSFLFFNFSLQNQFHKSIPKSRKTYYKCLVLDQLILD